MPCRQPKTSRTTKSPAALLTHREQRFRLSYMLGELDVDEESGTRTIFRSSDSRRRWRRSSTKSDEVSEEERGNERRESSRIISSASRSLRRNREKRTAEDFGPYADQKTPEDKAAWLELYSDRLFESEEFAKLALDIKR